MLTPPTVAGPKSEPGDTTEAVDQRDRFSEWQLEKRAEVQFMNPPEVDKEGQFCVINPVYRFGGRNVTEMVEDGCWYQNAFKGSRGALLIGCGNGRAPRSYKIGDLYIENDELVLRHRISFGGSKGATTRLLLDLDEKDHLTKIGIAIGDKFRGSLHDYPAIVADDVAIMPADVENLPKTLKKPNWIPVNYDLSSDPRDDAFFQDPVRIVWFQFQEGGDKLVRIEN